HLDGQHHPPCFVCIPSIHYLTKTAHCTTWNTHLSGDSQGRTYSGFPIISAHYREHTTYRMRTHSVARLQLLINMTKHHKVPGPPCSRRSLSMLAWFAIVLFLQAAFAQTPSVTNLLRREFVTKDLAVRSFRPI